MSVKQQAYKECWNWLNSDEEGPRPEPMDGLHPMVVEEWWVGYNAAVADYQIEEAKVDLWTDFTVRAAKLLLLVGYVTGIYLTGNPWIWVAGGIHCLYLLWTQT